jgi:hypothetical protein
MFANELKLKEMRNLGTFDASVSAKQTYSAFNSFRRFSKPLLYRGGGRGRRRHGGARLPVRHSEQLILRSTVSGRPVATLKACKRCSATVCSMMLKVAVFSNSPCSVISKSETLASGSMCAFNHPEPGPDSLAQIV